MQQIDYSTLNKRSINKFRELSSPEEVINMKCGETRGLRIDKGFILVEKYDGCSLKNMIRKNDFTNMLYKGFKLMIINRQRHPMFLNSKKEVYFCDNLEKKNTWDDEDEYETNPITIIGNYRRVIFDTYYDNDGIQQLYEYYLLIYTKGNLYDGTRHFIPTKNL